MGGETGKFFNFRESLDPLDLIQSIEPALANRQLC